MKYLLLSLLLASCSTYQPLPVEKVPDVLAPDSGVVTTVPAATSNDYFKAWEGLTSSKDEINKLIVIANCILNNPEFLAEMRASTFTSTDNV